MWSHVWMGDDDFVQLVNAHPVLHVPKRAEPCIRPEVYSYLLAVRRLDQGRTSMLNVPSYKSQRQVAPPLAQSIDSMPCPFEAISSILNSSL